MSIARIFFVLFFLFALTGCDEAYFRQYWLEHFPNIPLPQLPAEENSTTSSSQDTTPTVSALSASSDTCASLLETTPRGLSCLHCMEPTAREQAQVLEDVLLRSCLKSPAMNFLVDGSFSFDADVLLSHISALSTGGRRPYFSFYLTNGPSQRRWKNTAVQSFVTRISPKEFRTKIFSDYALQYKYQQLVQRLVPVLREAESAGAELALVPMLEDNLRVKDFRQLASLTLDALPTDIHVSIVRNPCPGCYSGNDDIIPSGVLHESHSASSTGGVRDGIVTNDGSEYDNPDSSSALKLSDLARLRDRAERANDVFFLWSGKRQGVEYQGSQVIYVAPSDRNYNVPSAAEQEDLVAFLRE